MRSHAKASTAGSTQHQAKGLGASFAGADATRDASLDAKGSSAPKSKHLALPFALLATIFSLALGTSSAFAAAPTISSTTVSAVTSKAALLEARINPEGEATTFHFEYGSADCSSNPCASTPIPNGNVGSGTSALKVIEEVEGLSPDTTYHFRVVAVNGSGTVAGPDRTFTTYEVFTPQTNCPNQAFRVGPAANLPDCRAYEMVSPVDKSGGEIARAFGAIFSVGTGFYQGAVSGEKLIYSSPTSFGDEPSSRNSNEYLAARGARGWSSHGINPPLTTYTIPYGFLSPYFTHRTYQAFSDDLSSGWLLNDNDPPLTPDAAKGFANLYRYNNDSFEALTLNEPTHYAGGSLLGEELTMELEFKGASADSSLSVYEAKADLTPDAPPNSNYKVYAVSNGETHLVSVLPNGTPDADHSVVGLHYSTFGYQDTVAHAVSDDGSRIVWTDPNASSDFGPGTIYVRENPTRPQSAISGGQCTETTKACTLQVGVGYFMTASSDGSKTLFTTNAGQLYEFDVETETSSLIASEVEAPNAVAGASDDLSYVYFVSREALDAGAVAGQPNLYLDREGAIQFIATLSAADASIGGGLSLPNVASAIPLFHRSHVTPDGRHLAFMSTQSLAGYDNTDAVGASAKSFNGNADFEVFLYDADADELTCVSCNPSSARPVGQPLVKAFTYSDSLTLFPPGAIQLWTAAWIPTWENEFHPPRVLSEDGRRLFFNSFDALTPEDTNGAQDVYQWEAQGSGNCQKAGGCIALISTGQSAEKSEFIDASADGRDVFIRTSSGIDPRDPGLYDIYDARVGGGYPLPSPAPECLGDACQGIPAAPNDPTPASAGFKGAGNPTPRKARRRCAARKRHAGKASAKHKSGKRCKHAKRRAGR